MSTFREELVVGGALLQRPQREGFQQGGRGMVTRKTPRLSKEQDGRQVVERRIGKSLTARGKWPRGHEKL